MKCIIQSSHSCRMRRCRWLRQAPNSRGGECGTGQCRWGCCRARGGREARWIHVSNLRPWESRIYNHTFSSMPSSVELQDCSLQRCEIPEDWRRDIWKIGKGNWDTNPKLLGLRDHTGLSRKYDQQNNILPKGKTRKHKLVLDFDAEVAKLEQRLNRRQKRNQIRREVWARKLQQADDSSSSSSTTSSEDSSE